MGVIVPVGTVSYKHPSTVPHKKRSDAGSCTLMPRKQKATTPRKFRKALSLSYLCVFLCVYMKALQVFLDKIFALLRKLLVCFRLPCLLFRQTNAILRSCLVTVKLTGKRL